MRSFNFDRKMIRFFFFSIIIIFESSAYSLEASKTSSCMSSYKNKLISRNEIELLVQTRASKENTTEYINLCGALLKGINLSGMDLAYVDFREADLQNADFTNSNLSNALFQGANLANANLTNVYLQQADLQEAKMQGATLNKANISNASLKNVNLSRASIKEADLHNSTLEYANLLLVDLQGSNLTDANLSNADLTNAMLKNTNFMRADLQNAVLLEANLEESNLINTNLQDTDLTQANLNQAIYKPNPNFLPNIISLANSKNFSKIKFYDDQLGAPALTALRNAYTNVGMKNMEKLITSMVKTQDMKKAWKTGGWGYVEAFSSYFLFYLTCNFGEAPGRPLRIFLALIFICAIPYKIAILKSSAKCGIYKVTPDELSKENTKVELLSYAPPFGFWNKIKYEIKQTVMILQISLLTSFQIGFQHFNISDWLSRAQSESYYFVMKGWIRNLAGFQSLLSLYLVILWALTYFGHPFSW